MSVFHICRSQINANLSKWIISNWNYNVRPSSIVDPRSMYAHLYLRQTAWQKKQYLKAQTVNPFKRKWETHRHVSQCCQFLILFLNCFLTVCILRKMKKSTPLWCEDCRFDCLETGLGKPTLTLHDPKGLQNTTDVYSLHLELWMTSPCQIRAGKWKYVNPCLDFLGIPDQRTAYVKRQVSPRWAYIRRSSVTRDLLRWRLPYIQ